MSPWLSEGPMEHLIGRRSLARTPSIAIVLGVVNEIFLITSFVRVHQSNNPISPRFEIGQPVAWFPKGNAGIEWIACDLLNRMITWVCPDSCIVVDELCV